MREIGGYFELENLADNEYYSNLTKLNNGRNALWYMIKAKNIQKLYIPYFLCDSVSNMLKKKGVSFEYYDVGSDFSPLFEKNLLENEFLYVVNFYGQISNTAIITLKQKFDNIIVDNTQAFFQEPLNGIDTLYSVRKFFGVPDGAYLATDKRLNEELKQDISKDRMIHILGRYEGKASDYYKFHHKNDEISDGEDLKTMSKLTRNLLGAIDYKKVLETRNRNYALIESKLGDKNAITPISPEGPFAYPFFIENGIEIRKQLAKEKIYIPVLWPNVLNDMPKESLEYQYAANILPLPCDQRYSEEDMEYMIGLLNGKIGNLREKSIYSY